MAYKAEDMLRFRIPDETECQIDHLQKIDLRAASKKCFRWRPATKTGYACAAYPLALCGINSAHSAIGEVFHYGPRGGASPVVEVDLEPLPRSVGLRDHLSYSLQLSPGGYRKIHASQLLGKAQQALYEIVGNNN